MIKISFKNGDEVYADYRVFDEIIKVIQANAEFACVTDAKTNKIVFFGRISEISHIVPE